MLAGEVIALALVASVAPYASGAAVVGSSATLDDEAACEKLKTTEVCKVVGTAVTAAATELDNPVALAAADEPLASSGPETDVVMVPFSM